MRRDWREADAHGHVPRPGAGGSERGYRLAGGDSSSWRHRLYGGPLPASLRAPLRRRPVPQADATTTGLHAANAVRTAAASGLGAAPATVAARAALRPAAA